MKNLDKILKIAQKAFYFVAITFVSMAFLLVSPLSINVSANTPTTSNLPTNSAICKGDNCKFIGNSGVPGTTGRDQLASLATSIAGILTFVTLSIAIVYMVWGGFIWMTDQDKGAERGRKMITNAVIAMVIVVAAYSITSIIISFLGSTVVSV